MCEFHCQVKVIPAYEISLTVVMTE